MTERRLPGEARANQPISPVAQKRPHPTPWRRRESSRRPSIYLGRGGMSSCGSERPARGRDRASLAIQGVMPKEPAAMPSRSRSLSDRISGSAGPAQDDAGEIAVGLCRLVTGSSASRNEASRPASHAIADRKAARASLHPTGRCPRNPRGCRREGKADQAPTIWFLPLGDIPCWHGPSQDGKGMPLPRLRQQRRHMDPGRRQPFAGVAVNGRPMGR